ncbi:MAG TPA: hypothetical protein VK735_18210 [Pseudonocardia sp.]|uniref:hypothetical protein n=1 Tax=Pseudonocardia sp. TaxID=60912 RepID=UPI002BFA5C5C|nr:hypothetical protein [Pseudonocardia sp.]HTF49379.1 hypothetical protein [Pseudonocardia sp.]
MNLDEAAQHLEGCDLPPPADEARNMLFAELERLSLIAQRAREVLADPSGWVWGADGVAAHILGEDT